MARLSNQALCKNPKKNNNFKIQSQPWWPMPKLHFKSLSFLPKFCKKNMPRIQIPTRSLTHFYFLGEEPQGYSRGLLFFPSSFFISTNINIINFPSTHIKLLLGFFWEWTLETQTLIEGSVSLNPLSAKITERLL